MGDKIEGLRDPDAIKSDISAYFQEIQQRDGFLKTPTFFRDSTTDSPGRGPEVVSERLAEIMPGFVDLYIELAAATDEITAWSSTVNFSLRFSGGKGPNNFEKVNILQCPQFVFELTRRVATESIQGNGATEALENADASARAADVIG